MAGAYTVQIDLKLNEDVQKKLEQILPHVQRLEQAFERLHRAMNSQAGSVRQFNTEMSSTARHMGSAQRAAQGTAQAFANVGQQAQQAHQNVSLLAKAMNALRGGGSGHGGGFSLGNSINEVQNIVGGIQSAVQFTEAVSKPGMELTRIENQMRMTGWSNAQIQRAEKKASEIRRTVPGASMIDSMQGMLEMKSVFASPDEAIDKSKLMARANLVLEASNETPAGWKGEKSKQYAMAIVKSAEMLGAVSDMKKFDKVVNTIIQTGMLSGGKLTPQAIQMQLASEGPVRQMLGLDTQLFMVQHLGQEMATGGSGGGRGRAGTQLAALGRNLLGGTLTKQGAESLRSLGLLEGGAMGPGVLGKDGVFSFGSVSKNIKDGSLFQNDLVKWAGEDLRPALEKKYPGFSKMNNLDQSRVFNQATMGLNAGAKTILQELTLDSTRANILRQQEQRAKLPSFETEVGLAGQDPAVKMKSLATAWEELLTKFSKNKALIALFNGTLDLLTKALELASRMMDRFNDFVNKHQGILILIQGAFEGLVAEGKAVVDIVNALTEAFKGMHKVMGADANTGKSAATPGVIPAKGKNNPSVGDAWNWFAGGIGSMFKGQPAGAATTTLAPLSPGILNGPAGNIAIPDGALTALTAAEKAQVHHLTAKASKGMPGMTPPPPPPGGILSPSGFGELAGSKFTPAGKLTAGSMVPPPGATHDLVSAMLAGGQYSTRMSAPPAPTKVAPPPPIEIHVHYAPGAAVDPNRHARELAGMIKPYLDKMTLKDVHQFAASASFVGGNLTSPVFSS